MHTRIRRWMHCCCGTSDTGGCETCSKRLAARSGGPPLPRNLPGRCRCLRGLSGFSGYVHDTPYDRTIQQCPFFSSKARYQIINDGGMVYQCQGDAVIRFFGLPDHPAACIDRAFEWAKSLLMLPESVSNEWHRRLDRVQPVHGGHVGIAMGDIQLNSSKRRKFEDACFVSSD